MALEPCKECGTLNSTEAEICLACEYPTKGRARSNWLKWIAIGLALLFGLPIIIEAIQVANRQINPQPSQPSRTVTSE